MTTPDVPGAAVTAAAEAAFNADRLPGEPDWADLAPDEADSYRRYARIVLTAALPHLQPPAQNEPGA